MSDGDVIIRGRIIERDADVVKIIKSFHTLQKKVEQIDEKIKIKKKSSSSSTTESEQLNLQPKQNGHANGNGAGATTGTEHDDKASLDMECENVFKELSLYAHYLNKIQLLQNGITTDWKNSVALQQDIQSNIQKILQEEFSSIQKELAIATEERKKYEEYAELLEQCYLHPSREDADTLIQQLQIDIEEMHSQQALMKQKCQVTGEHLKSVATLLNKCESELKMEKDEADMDATTAEGASNS